MQKWGNGFVDQPDEGKKPSLSDQQEDFLPLIEAISNWQGIFEMALDDAAQLLTPEQFPAEDLHASLSEMCDLLRDIFTQQSTLSTQER
jgi:hypothetical protein